MLVVSSGFFSAALVTVSIATAFAVLSNALHFERHTVFTLEVEACSLAGKIVWLLRVHSQFIACHKQVCC